MTAVRSKSTEQQAAGTESVYSIGAVGSMVGVPPATLRTWEDRYGLISPGRTLAGHRLYSRGQVEQLRWIASEVSRGTSTADAHRLLADRIQGGQIGGEEDERPGRQPRILILVAERDKYSAELIEFLLRTEGFGVDVALDAAQALDTFEKNRPQLSVIEFLIDGGVGEMLCRRFKEQSSNPVLVVSGLDVADRALKAGADAFMTKPLGSLKLVSGVKDLLGMSAMLDSPRSM